MGNSVGKTKTFIALIYDNLMWIGFIEKRIKVFQTRGISSVLELRSCIWLIRGMYERKLAGKKEEAKTYMQL